MLKTAKQAQAEASARRLLIIEEKLKPVMKSIDAAINVGRTSTTIVHLDQLVEIELRKQGYTITHNNTGDQRDDACTEVSW